MASLLPFTKMQGAGNDYIYINGFRERVSNPAELAVKMSDRHFGVGADGLVLILPSATCDARMRMFNADGSEAEMCGNASRCVAKYVYDHGLASKDLISLETAAGVKLIRLLFADGSVVGATVDMGRPALDAPSIPVLAPGAGDAVISMPVTVDRQEYRITAVSMGNPHAALFMADIDNLDLARIGPALENHPVFPQRANIEFVEVLARDRIRMRVWERGSGETLACGTGACAALVACALNGLTGNEADVEMRGGRLHVKWDRSQDHVFLSGPAVTVFKGEYILNEVEK